MRLSGAGTILAKDLRLRLRDRSVIVLGVIVPLALAALFTAILPDAEELDLTAAVVDLDGTPTSSGFAGLALPGLIESGFLELVEVDGEEAARERLTDGELDAAWVLPEGMEADLQAGRGATIETLVDPDGAVRAEIATSIAESYAQRMQATVLTVAGASALGLDGTDALAGEVSAAPPPLTVEPLETERRQLDETSYMTAGMASFFVFFIVGFGVTGLLEERQLQTLPRILASPVTRGAVIAGKAMGAAILGLASLGLLAVAFHLLLDADWGPAGAIAVLVAAIVVSALGLLALVATFARTAEQASNLQSIVAVVLGMLGGAFFPLPLDEGVLAVLAKVSPHAWFLQGLGDASAGDVGAALPAAGAMVLIGLVGAGLAALRLRRSGL